VHSLLGKLAPPAEGLNFQRTAQQSELSQAGSTLEQLVHSGYLYVMDPPASNANDVVMRFDVAVIARDFVQQRYLARLSHFAKLLQNPMDCGQGYVWIPAPYCGTDLVGARMILGSEQGPDNREPLRRDGNPPFTTSRDKLAESLI